MDSRRRRTPQSSFCANRLVVFSRGFHPSFREQGAIFPTFIAIAHSTYYHDVCQEVQTFSTAVMRQNTPLLICHITAGSRWKDDRLTRAPSEPTLLRFLCFHDSILSRGDCIICSWWLISHGSHLRHYPTWVLWVRAG